jgi:hypothetical protein
LSFASESSFQAAKIASLDCRRPTVLNVAAVQRLRARYQREFERRRKPGASVGFLARETPTVCGMKAGENPYFSGSYEDFPWRKKMEAVRRVPRAGVQCLVSLTSVR